MLNIMHHLLSSFLLINSLYLGVNEKNNFQNFLGILDNIIGQLLNWVGNNIILRTPISRVLENHFLFEIISYYYIPTILLKLVVCIYIYMHIIPLLSSCHTREGEQ